MAGIYVAFSWTMWSQQTLFLMFLRRSDERVSKQASQQAGWPTEQSYCGICDVFKKCPRRIPLHNLFFSFHFFSFLSILFNLCFFSSFLRYSHTLCPLSPLAQPFCSLLCSTSAQLSSSLLRSQSSKTLATFFIICTLRLTSLTPTMRRRFAPSLDSFAPYQVLGPLKISSARAVPQQPNLFPCACLPFCYIILFNPFLFFTCDVATGVCTVLCVLATYGTLLVGWLDCTLGGDSSG